MLPIRVRLGGGLTLLISTLSRFEAMLSANAGTFGAIARDLRKPVFAGMLQIHLYCESQSKRLRRPLESPK